MSQEPLGGDDSVLRGLGYVPELRRALSLLASFSIAFSYISPVVGVYTLFGYGLLKGGPAFIWGLPVVVMGQLLVVLVFCELAVRYPLAGALYQWGRRLVGPRYGWFVGWIYGWALLITIAAVDLGAAPYLADLVGLPPTRVTLALLAALLVAAHTAMNLGGVRLTAIVTTIGLSTEVVATVVIAGALLLAPGTGGLLPLGTLLSRQTPSGPAGSGASLAAMLALAWIFYGFESAADVAEEVIEARRSVPRAMILSLLGAGLVTMILLVALVLSAGDLKEASGDPDRVMDVILARQFGPRVLQGLLVLLMSAYLSCAGAAQAAAARLMYSYARDSMVPGSGWLRSVTKAHAVPKNALLVSGAIALMVVAATFVDFGRVNVKALVVSYAVVGVYLSFQSVVAGRLIAAARGFRVESAPGYFSLGRWSIAISCLALAYGLAMIVNLCWPRPWEEPSSWLTLAAASAIVLPGSALALFSRRAGGVTETEP